MIGFTSVADDWALTGEYQLANSSTLRGSSQAGADDFGGAAAVRPAVLWFATRSLAGVAGGLFVGVFMVAEAPKQARRRIRRHMRELWAESQASGLSSECRLDASDAGLACTSSSGSGTLNWSAIKRVEETPSHVILSGGPSTVIAIPRERVEQGDLAAFVAECRRYIGAQGA